MVLIALLVAYRQRQTQIVSWLLPLTIGHGVALLYELYDFSFRYFYLRASLASSIIAYGFGFAGALISLYTTWRVLEFVKNLPVRGAAALPEEGVWPPPPTRSR